MTLRPPTSTLFPYTTLFRSLLEVVDDLVQRRVGVARVLVHVAGLPRRHRDAVGQEDAVLQDAEQDRKSTRLNSSHLVISYAVFCLKKKKELSAQTSDTITTQ